MYTQVSSRTTRRSATGNTSIAPGWNIWANGSTTSNVALVLISWPKRVGTERRPEGTVYEGEFRAGKKNGRGRFTWTDGSYYEGEFRDNELEGEGTYRATDGKVHKGLWANSMMNGKGEYSWPDGRIYRGDFVDDQPEGFGTMTWYQAFED